MRACGWTAADRRAAAPSAPGQPDRHRLRAAGLYTRLSAGNSDAICRSSSIHTTVSSLGTSTDTSAG